MTRYLVFVFEEHEASGGADDCEGVFDTLDEAKAVAKVLRRKHIERYGGGGDDDESVHAHVLEVGETLIVHRLTFSGIWWRDYNV